jgi:outer membrane protein assembly factor BamB
MSIRQCRNIVCVIGLLGFVHPGCAKGLPEGFDKQSPSFRGASGMGVYRDAVAVPVAWSEKDSTGILWKAKLDLPGWASPVVWGGKVVVTEADASKRLVACFDAVTGKQLWKTELAGVDGATLAYTLNTQSEQWNTRMHAASTPATNGKQVFALFSNGQLAALDLETGKVAWSIGLGNTSENSYGLASSLLILGDSVMAVFQGAPSFIAAYDAVTGKEKWKTVRKSATWASPILITTASGKSLVVLPADPDVTAWDPETGKVVWTADVMTTSPQYCVGPSPVFADGVVVVNCENHGMAGIDAETGKKVWGLAELANGEGFSDGVSMTTDGKNVYQYFRTCLTCVAARTGKVVKQKDTDDASTYASPVIAGGNLYLFGSSDTLILKADPAADFPAVGKGSLKDSFDASPAAANGRLFIRTDESLYCIGAK